MRFTKKLSSLDKEDVSIAGGKGASLGEMLKAGIPVPHGFAVLSGAFEHFIEHTELNVEIDSILDSVDINRMHTVEDASEKIHALILDADMPDEIADELNKQFRKLNSSFVAVRSSATSEDSAEATWAGQLESYLNTTEKNLVENVKKCWASLFSPRAIFYRFHKNLHKEHISVAVVVQKMIESEESGIAFSVHPVTQDRNQLIIEAGFGLGEAIVSGQITPDSYVVEKEVWLIADKNVNEQKRMLVKSSSGGNEWKELAREKAKIQALSDREIIRLSKLIVKIESHFGFPVDVEFAKEKGKFYIVQSRPITTLSKNNILSITNKFLNELGNQELFVPIHNSTLFTQTSGWNTKRYFENNYIDKTPFPILITVNKKEGIMFIPFTKAKKIAKEIFKRYWNNASALSKIINNYNQQRKIIDDIYLKANYKYINSENFEDLMPLAKTIKSAAWEMNALAFFSIAFDKKICLKSLKEVGSKIDAACLNGIWEKGTMPISDSFEKRRLYYLAELLNKNKAWDEISEMCQYFEANYNKIADIKETKNNLKKKYAYLENRKSRKKIINEEKKEKNKIAKEYERWSRQLNKEEKILVHFLQTIIDLRDSRKDYISKSFVVIFRIAQKLFNNADLPENLIYFYTYDELIKGKEYLLKIKSSLEKRKNGCTIFVNYEGNMDIEYVSFDHTKKKLENLFISQYRKIRNKKIKGQTGSKGVVEGRAKIIQNIDGPKSKFNEGDILVTGMTRPEFSALIKKAGAIVTDEGGITCHAAIISRELNKPCIIGTGIATQILKDGDLVEVDADKGIIKIIKTNKK